MNPIHRSAPATTPAPKPVRERPEAQSSAPTVGPIPELEPDPLSGLAHFGVVQLRPDQVDTPKERELVALEMVSQLEEHPQLGAVIGLVPQESGNTELVVASRPDAASGSAPQGVYEVIERLASSPAVKAAARAHPVDFQPARPFDSGGLAEEVRLPGAVTPRTLARALRVGGKSNQYGQLSELIRDLPQGRRVALCVGGPSAAGKSTLIKMIRELAGDRNVVTLTGDMFFRDANDPAAPRNEDGSVYWDSPAAMHLDEMSAAIAQLVSEGRADLPVYDFGATPPGASCKGARTGQVNPTELGADDILVIDSLHAMNPEVIAKLDGLGLPHVSVYLDSPDAEDRLVRRIVRDYAARGRTPEMSLADWDQSTFPGEVNFVRPTLAELDPARDLFLVTELETDGDLTREQIDRKVELMSRYGVTPSYAAFDTPDEQMAAFARSEALRFQAVLDDPRSSEADKAGARAGLEALRVHAGSTQS